MDNGKLAEETKEEKGKDLKEKFLKATEKVVIPGVDTYT